MEVSCKLSVLEKWEVAPGWFCYNEAEGIGDGFEWEKLSTAFRRWITMMGEDVEVRAGRRPLLRQDWLVLTYSVTTLYPPLPHL